MSRAESAVVVDADGLSFRARLEPAADGAQALLELEDGTQFLVPAELLVPRADGRFDLRLRLREYAAQTGQGEALETGLETGAPAALASEADVSVAYEAVTETVADDAAMDDTAVIALAEETLRIAKRTVERGRVRLHKTVTERFETVDIALMREAVEVERVSIGRPVEEASPIRYEGDVMVIPRFEEVLVVSKQLVLVEELRVTRRRSEHREPQQVVLRREELAVERTGDGAADEPD